MFLFGYMFLFLLDLYLGVECLNHIIDICLILLNSMTQSCPTLCDLMDHSMPGFPVHHQLPELLKLMSIKSVMLSNHFILYCPLLLLPSVFPIIRVFSMCQFFASGGQSIGVSASALVLPMNIQD